eukprot:8758457-Pyramimonas_sp.AAC.1
MISHAPTAASSPSAAGSKDPKDPNYPKETSPKDPGSSAKKQKFDVGVTRLKTAEAKQRALQLESDKLKKSMTLASKAHKEGIDSGEKEKNLLLERFLIGAMVLGKDITIEVESIASAQDIDINANFKKALEGYKAAQA